MCSSSSTYPATAATTNCCPQVVSSLIAVFSAAETRAFSTRVSKTHRVYSICRCRIISVKNGRELCVHVQKLSMFSARESIAFFFLRRLLYLLFCGESASVRFTIQLSNARACTIRHVCATTVELYEHTPKHDVYALPRRYLPSYRGEISIVLPSPG